ncbi:squalene/phytoene synthase family protein [Mesobacillus maritimus]|uniref:squalene/phytoene synthase family protein n=1 Tax=Mesobacillus maritimus TaxID=1643336 RepID=UPI00203E099A|nr:squalene/phytoene synthase family protein [Mesobacillus maritimus]MCM3584759.1 squalene/phytoene synthase family protein [Mesobacillus maritimus]MCM3671875.1 squalene/phytoene synthase family protein [Mesobacillus maritimus]
MNKKNFPKDAIRVLKETSRTFYIPITFLQKELKHSVASAYLVFRAIDEIEDHPEIENDVKYEILMQVSELFKQAFNEEKYVQILEPVKDRMPEVTLRLGEWVQACPKNALPLVMAATSEMAFGMAKWAKVNWKIETRADLDDYTYYVAGLVGVLLSDLWELCAGIKTDRDLAIGYGRGLQAVNILRNEQEDLDERGVRFVPDGWTRTELFDYATENLAKADEYMKSLHNRSVILFCRLPLALAHKSLKAMKDGREKISRTEVEETVDEIQVD